MHAMIPNQTAPGNEYDMKIQLNLGTVHKIWELNSPFCAHPQPNTFAHLKPPFCLLLPKQLPVKRHS